MSLKHQRLYDRVLWGLERQFYQSRLNDIDNDIRCQPADKAKLYHAVEYLWRQVIFDRPMHNIAIRGQRSDWKHLPKSKSLFNQPDGQGIVIGNLTSQLLSNIYLDQLDRFIRFELGYPHYGRYVDDFFIIVPLEKRPQLLRDIPIIRDFLKNQLELTLHPHKCHAQLVEKGVPFIGAVIYPGFIIPGKRIRRKTYQAAYRLSTGNIENLEGLVSRLGSNEHINHRRFFKKLFDSFGWEYNWLPESKYIKSHPNSRLRSAKSSQRQPPKSPYIQTSLFKT